MPGVGGRGKCGVTANMYVVSFCDDENILKLGRGDGCTNCGCTKCHWTVYFRMVSSML